MKYFQEWLKDQMIQFYNHPISYAYDFGVKILVIAIGLWILSGFVQCSGKILGL